MNCEECREQMVAHMEGLLGQSLQSRLESHLDDCLTCRAELDRMRDLFDRLVRNGSAAPSVSPDLRLTGQLILGQTSIRRRNLMKRIAKIAAAAVLVIGAFAGIPQFFGNADGTAALAQAAEHLRQANSVSWTNIFYQNLSSKDQKTTWVEISTMKEMYKAPGLERTVHLDPEGRVQFVEITDHMRAIRLHLNPGEMTAQLNYYGEPLQRTRNNFTDTVTSMSQWLTKTEDGWIMGEPKPLGKKNIKGREAVGFRVSPRRAQPLLECGHLGRRPNQAAGSDP